MDVQSSSIDQVICMIPMIQAQHGTSISLIAGGDQVSRWARLRIVGKPLAIHLSVARLFEIGKCQEAGDSPDVSFPSGIEPQSDEDADRVPVFHAAWTEFSMRHKQS